jgi:DNA-binding NtrC family response regulator
MAMKDRVLVVDDDRDARETLASALAQSGYLVQVASDARDGLVRLDRWPADVVVSDVCLPGGVSGVQLMRTMRERGLAQPVVLITGLERDLGGPAQTGEAAACLHKPMSLDELIWAIDCALACRTANPGDRVAARVPPERVRWAGQ